MKLTIEIDSDNEAVTPELVATYVESIASHVASIFGKCSRPIKDANGNTIGRWMVDSTDYMKRELEQYND